jgi:peptidoglycan hydrolase CwlO-like protein
LQDGTVITVAVENGVSTVTSVKAPEAPAAAPEMAATVQAVQNQVTGFSEQLKTFASEKQEFASKIESQGKLIEAQKAEIESLKSNVSEFITLFASVLEVPSGQPIEKPRNKFSTSVEQKINTLSKFKPKN